MSKRRKPENCQFVSVLSEQKGEKFIWEAKQQKKEKEAWELESDKTLELERQGAETAKK